ncbi:cGMP-dependent 3',5'-cyclic phosphodiesterase [Leptinotarsa decemlineata]|uniref:cGMP-dependent 3',5'-cyclic phosphodiesterase n=1 Tax=Leptinotarsa decemlineata TaxID=7539 RepID=UPI000C255013|nr:cGMP-dependent 3',5'-cyclic phosphodiesterase-like [Leptinotarsa decemlineata]
MSSETNELFLPPPYCKKLNPEDNVFREDISMPKIEVSDPGKILQLCEILTDRTTKKLEVKINRYLKSESESTSVFLINLLNVSEEAVVQVVDEKILESSIRTSLSEDTISNIVEYKDNSLKCAENLDPKIQKLINDIVGNDAGELMIVPILANERRANVPKKKIITPVYLICFAHSSKDNSYITRLVHETFKYCLTLLLNTRECEEERRLKQQCQTLLTVARKLFSHLGDLSDLLKEIMSEARRLTNAERCSLFLLDPDHMHLVAKVFDGVSPAEKRAEVRIAKDQGIAGHVAASGQILNIKNAYKHPLFYKGVDEATGFKTRNILCFPIRDEDTIVGVAQLCNKIDGHFDYFDEQVANAFSIYCGISIMHSLVYKKIQDAQARSQLSNELMIYHMQVMDQDVADVATCSSLHDFSNFESFSFIPRKVFPKEIPCCILKMFENLDFVNHFRIRKEALIRFILFVKKGYRALPYHNWLHAFSVAHFAYLCIRNFQLVEMGYLTKLEALSYIVSCLCHDVDHRGTTNSFQQQSNSVLASLYSSEGSVMERHHLSQTICILNTEGCNFLESLNRDDYIKCLDLIKNMILATDLATHYRIHSRQLAMAQEGYNKTNPEHRYYLCSLLMTCADLSDQTKDWPETKKVAQLIYTEFFMQGDLEKKMGKQPEHMMDREKASIPDHQLEFLNECCICIFRILATMFPVAKVLVDSIKKNIIAWESSKTIFEKLCVEGRTSYEVLTSDELEQQVQATLSCITGL